MKESLNPPSGANLHRGAAKIPNKGRGRTRPRPFQGPLGANSCVEIFCKKPLAEMVFCKNADALTGPDFLAPAWAVLGPYLGNEGKKPERFRPVRAAELGRMLSYYVGDYLSQ